MSLIPRHPIRYTSSFYAQPKLREESHRVSPRTTCLIAEADREVDLGRAKAVSTCAHVLKDAPVTHIVDLAGDLNLRVGGDVESSRTVRARAVRTGTIAAVIIPEACDDLFLQCS